MKNEINLLPPAVTKARTRRLFSRQFNRLYRTILLCLVIVGATYAGVWWVTWQSLSEVENGVGATSRSSQNRAAEQEVRKVNELLKAVQQRTAGYESWTARVSEALSVASSEISITTISLRSASGAAPGSPKTLVVTGTALSRSAVVAYEQALRSLSWVERVEAPLQNLASGSVVTFSFTIYGQAPSL